MRAVLTKLGILLAAGAVLSLTSVAQSPPANSPPPRSQDSTQTEPSAKSKQQNPAPSNTSGESSSKATIIDISPPVGDVQEHPESEAAHESVNELKPWDPHRAAKDIEVGEYYFKRKNYRGAESRFRDALLYKPNDALATFRMAQVFERTGRGSEARQYYADYLKILPHGPFAEEARKALEKVSVEK